MTIQELHYDFDFKMDKVASQSKENFLAPEKDWLLNEAQNVFVKQRYSGNNPLRLALDEHQKRMDDLAPLHVKFPDQPAIVPTSLGDGVYEIPLASLDYDYLFLTRVQANVTDPVCGTKVIKVNLIQTDDLTETVDMEDPFQTADIDNGVPANFGKSSASLAASSLYFYPGITLTLNDVRFEYLKKPRQMFLGGYTYIDSTTPATVECELPAHTHTEIVDIAVKIAAGIIEHPTYTQLKSQKVFEHE